jgi:hypothetical protein
VSVRKREPTVLLWLGFIASGAGALFGLTVVAIGHIQPGLFLFLLSCVGILNYRYEVSLSERKPPS